MPAPARCQWPRRAAALCSLVVGAAAMAFSTQPGATEIDRETQLRLALSVMKLEVVTPQGYELGSAVLVGPDLLVTNCHVTRRAKAINVLQGGLRHPATAQASNVVRDLCLVRVPGLDGQPVAMASAASLQLGQPLLGLGYSGGLGLQFGQGELVSLHRFDDGRVIRSGNFFTSGASGGGLFDAQGRLVGMLTFRLRGGQSHYFSIPADWIESLMNDASRFQPVAPLEGQAFWEMGTDAPPFLITASLAAAQQWRELSLIARQWANDDPRDVGAPLALGNALEQLGDLAEAESAFAAAVEMEPDDAFAWLRRGQLQARLGRVDAARATLARLVQLNALLAEQLAAMPQLQ